MDNNTRSSGSSLKIVRRTAWDKTRDVRKTCMPLPDAFPVLKQESSKNTTEMDEKIFNKWPLWPFTPQTQKSTGTISKSQAIIPSSLIESGSGLPSYSAKNGLSTYIPTKNTNCNNKAVAMEKFIKTKKQIAILRLDDFAIQ